MPESDGPEMGLGSKPSAQFESYGDRFRFYIELRPGETTTVSWKKLLKEANITNGNANNGPNGPGPLEAEIQQQPVPPQPLIPKPRQAEGEAQDPAGTNRLSSVIERIERMYAGNGSSDDEDAVLDDVPDEDEYDTEDSFIDDTELDDYFQVDKSKLKHDGFFINRGKLEHIEPPSSTSQQPKKRRRKDLKEDDGKDGANNPPKKVKLGNKSQKESSFIERNPTSQSSGMPVPSIHSADVLPGASPTNVTEFSVKKKKIESKVALDSSETLNRDHVWQDKYADQQSVLPSKNNSSKLKEAGKLPDASTQKSIKKMSAVNKSHAGQQSDNMDKLNQHIQQKEKVALVGRFDLNVPATPNRNSLEISKSLPLRRKEGSNVKQRSVLLEKAIRELEKIVSESRPPSTEVEVPDNISHVAKKRVPPEIKQKLAKVARLSYAGFGKIPDDVLNRLMSIVGHLMQLRTLKRNIKAMANIGLSAKQEKDDQLQKIKHEVEEMVAQRILHMKSKIKQQLASSDDFQESCPPEKKASIRKYSMDDALENKICDLYDLYIERSEEESGPPVRRLYEELAAFWPSGIMDNDGIKNAIYRAKKRKKLQPNQQQNPEKLKKKKLTPKPEDRTGRGEAANTVLTSMNVREKVMSDSLEQSLHQASNPVLSLPATNSPNSFHNLASADKPKQEKRKGISSTSTVDANSAENLPKKKVKKKKPSTETGDRSQFLPEKISEEKAKHYKDVAVPISKPNVQKPLTAGSESNLN